MRFTTKNIALLGLLLISFSTSLLAATINVTTLADEDNNDGDCSLREAIAAANTNTAVDNCTAGQSGVVDQITVNQFGTVNLTSTLIVTEQVEISGMGRLLTRLSGQNQRQVLQINMSNASHDFVLTDIRIENGRFTNTADGLGGAGVQLRQGNRFTFERVNFFSNADFENGGGAIYAGPLDGDGSSLVIDDCVFRENISSVNGAALYSLDNGVIQSRLEVVNITESAFIDNVPFNGSGGGAIVLRGVDTVTIRRNQFIGNSTDSGGGALTLSTPSGQSIGIAIVERNSFLDNSSSTQGGALFINNTTALLTNNTLVGNNSDTFAEALSLFNRASVILHYNTFSENGSGSADEISVLACFDCEMTARSNIFWTSQPDDEECRIVDGAVYTSLGTNIDGGSACATDPTDLPMTDPLLLPLDDYGEDIPNLIVMTSPPRASSPAIDNAANNGNSCPGPFGTSVNIDHRGFSKPVNGDGMDGSGCDIGAIEYQPGMDPADFALNVSFSGMGDGQVTSNPAGVDCTVDCSAGFLEDTMVSLTPTADAGSEFTGWSGDCNGAGACQVTMDEVRDVTANFELTGFNLQVVIGGNGQGMVTSSPVGINCPGDCSEVYPEAEMVSLNATPEPGFQFLNWAGDCTGNSTCQVSLNQPRRVIAIFATSDTIFIGNFE